MPDLPGMPSSVRCAACGFENTTTSLYCQDCGLRLVPPPSAIAEDASPLPAPAKAAVRPVKTSPRILTARHTSRVRTYLKITIRTLIIAAFAALILQILRPPADIPPAAIPLSPEIVGNVRSALQLSAQRSAPFDAPWSGQGLNAYLAAVLPPTSPSDQWHFAFRRALLAPSNNNAFSLFVEREIFGLTLCSRIDYRLVSRGNGIAIAPVSIALGQLPLPVWISPAVESTNGSLAQGLSPELETLRSARSVKITPQKASVYFGPSSP